MFGRDQDGVLVVIKKATGAELVACLKTKLFAIGLFPWLETNNIREREVAPAPTSAAKGGTARSSVVVGATNDGSPGSSGGGGVVVENKRSSVAASSITRGSVVASDANGKANLLALFGKKNSIAGAAAGKRSSVSAKKGPKYATDIPLPPPVPTCWPPVPYTGVTGSGAAGGDSSGNPNSGSSTPVGDGSAAALGGSDNPSYDPSKPKLKQVYLVGLSSTANTLWETNDTNDVDINVSVVNVLIIFALVLVPRACRYCLTH